MDKKPIFDAVRTMMQRGFTQAEVATLDTTIEETLGRNPTPDAPQPNVQHALGKHTLGLAGSALIKKWEGCAKRLPNGTFTAFPDPGSADGIPWTIGWGSTGADIKKGLIWTQAQCDARFDRDIQRYVKDVRDFVDTSPTSAHQFDALVSFHYNTGAIRKSTLGKLHKQGNFTAAAAEFGKWINNNGKPMNGLIARRKDEAVLYNQS